MQSWFLVWPHSKKVLGSTPTWGFLCGVCMLQFPPPSPLTEILAKIWSWFLLVPYCGCPLLLQISLYAVYVTNEVPLTQCAGHLWEKTSTLIQIVIVVPSNITSTQTFICEVNLGRYAKIFSPFLWNRNSAESDCQCRNDGAAEHGNCHSLLHW